MEAALRGSWQSVWVGDNSLGGVAVAGPTNSSSTLGD